MCGPGCKFLGSFMLIPISISGVNKALQLGLMRLCHREGSSEVGGRPRMDDSVSFQQRRLKNKKKSTQKPDCVWVYWIYLLPPFRN